MRTKKQFLAALLCGCLLLAGCGEGQGTTEADTSGEPAASTTAEPAAGTASEIAAVAGKSTAAEQPTTAVEQPKTTAATTEAAGPPKLSIRFFSVDEVENWGDCTYIELPNGENMLIDIGMPAAAAIIVDELLDEGIDEIDHFIMTHSHADHVKGLSNLLANMKVNHAYSSGYFTTDYTWTVRDLESRGADHTVIKAGDSFSIGDVRFDVLWPTAESVAESPKDSSKAEHGPGSIEDVNGKSLVIKMTYGENTALFTGDIFTKDEGEILKLYQDEPDILKADVLKVMHHGYSTSGTTEFIEAVSPKWAVSMGTITMTNMLYNRYTKVGCTTYLSWMNGNVYVTMDGKDITVTPDNPEIQDYYK